MQHERITLEIPTSRKAFADWWYAPKNRKLVYYLSLATWTILFVFMMTILPLTATSTYRVAFYLPLVIFMLLLILTTHWLLQSAMEDYRAAHRNDDEPTVYNVMADDTILQHHNHSSTL